MASRIKGITIEIGGDTTGLQTALKDVNSNVNKTQRELKDVKKLLNLDPTNTELLAQKQELLSKQIANVSEKLDTLKEAERQAQAQFERGDISEEQYRALQREVTATEIELKELNKEASETAGAEKDLSDNAKDAADDVKKVEESSGSASSVLEGLGTAAKAAAAATAAAFAAATAAVAAATKALADCTVEGAAYADGVLTESTVTGIATDKLQGYMYAAELVDVSTETLTKSMAKNIKSMTSAAEGSGAAAEAYAALGVSVTNADGSLRDGEVVYWELIDALGGVEDETTRDSLAMQVLGKSAQELNPLITAGSARMRELGAEAEAAGYVMSGDTLNAYGALDDAMQRLDVGATAAKNALGTVLLPILTEMSETGVGLLNEFSAGVQDANGDIEKIGDVINGIIPKVVAAVTDLAPELFDIVGNAIETIADAIVNNAPELMDAAEDILDAIIKTIERVLPQLINTATQLIGRLMKSLTKELPKIIRLVISSIKDIVQAISKDAGKFAQAAVDIIVEVADALTDNIGDILKAVVKIVTDVAKAITKPENIRKLLKAVVKLVGELIKGLFTAAADILLAVFDIIGNIAKAIFGGYKESAEEAEDANKDLAESTEDLTASVDVLARKYEDLIEAAQATTEGMKDAQDAFDDTVYSLNSEEEAVQDLWEELQNLVDENGNILEGEEDQADLILGKLNDALGTEFSRTGDIVKNYQNMETAIYDALAARKAYSLVEAYGDNYDAASEASREWKENGDTLIQSTKEFAAGLIDLYGYGSQIGVYANNMIMAINSGDLDRARAIITWMEDYNDAQERMAGQRDATVDQFIAIAKSMTDAEAAATEGIAVMDTYNKAQEALAQGDYDAAIRILEAASGYRYLYMKKGKEISETELQNMKKAYDDALYYADWYAEKYAEGAAGFTEDGLAEAQSYADQLGTIYEDCAEDSYYDGVEIGESLVEGVDDGAEGLGAQMEDVGGDAVDGLVRGIDDNRYKVEAAARRMANAVPDTSRVTLEIASPSKLMKRLGGYVTEGFEEGIAEKLGDLDATASSVAATAAAGFGTAAVTNNNSNSTTNNLGGITLVVNGSGIDNVETLADLVINKLSEQIGNTRGVFA